MTRRVQNSRLANAPSVAIVVLAAACSGPGVTDEGFISLGRNNSDGGVGAVGAIGSGFGARSSGGGTTGGAFPISNGGSPIGGTGGTIAPQGGTTGANGGMAGDAMGGTSTNGGTSTGGEGPSCGSGGMPVIPDDAGGGPQMEACGQAGPNQRICRSDGTVFHCGMTQYPVEQCAPGTCETGCCHAISDPCPIADPLALPSNDCAGDCDAIDSCAQTTFLNLTIAERDARIVRVGGPNMIGQQCENGGRGYFELFLEGAPAHLMVSPPWMLAASFTCADVSDRQCLVSLGGSRRVVVMTDVYPPPSRNIVIYADERAALICPPQY